MIQCQCYVDRGLRSVAIDSENVKIESVKSSESGSVTAESVKYHDGECVTGVVQ